MGFDSLPVRCGCGHAFEVPADPGRGDTACPKCGEAIAVGARPATPPAPAVRPQESAPGKVAIEKGAAEPVRLSPTGPDKMLMRCTSCRKTYNVRGYKPGTTRLCRNCNAPLVILSTPTDLHVSDTGPGVRRAQSAPPIAADLIPGYTIEQKLGSGGMGDVYLARQTSLDRKVAVKILPPEMATNRTYVERFLTEARSAARLTQENIVAAVDAGESKGRYYFVMEYVQGETLQQIIQRDGALPENRVLEVGRQVATGLRHAHRQGLIHRDIKPANIMIAADGTAKICDFGLARQIESADVGLTQPGVVHSSPAYASPEQCRGKRDIDHRSDMYSLGVTLFQALTGERPFKAESTGELFIQHATAQPPAPKSLNPSISSGANQLVLRLLRKAPEGRFKDYDELLAAMNKGPQAASQPKATRRTVAPAAPKPIWLQPPVIKLAAGAAAAILGIIAIILVIGAIGSSAPDETDPQAAARKADSPVRRHLAELRARQDAVAKRPEEIPDVRLRWKERVEQYRGTPDHPAFAAGLEEFETAVSSEAGVQSRRLLRSIDPLILTGKEAEALAMLRAYPAGYAGTDGAGRVAARESEVSRRLEDAFRTESDRIVTRVLSGRFDDARTSLAALKSRVTVPGPGGPRIVAPSYEERLDGLAKSIQEEELLAKARTRRTPNAAVPGTGGAKPAPAAAPAAVPATPTAKPSVPAHFQALLDPAARADSGKREAAVAIFGREAKNSAFYRAAEIFLSRDDKAWGLEGKSPALAALQKYFSSLAFYRVASMPPSEHYRVFVDLAGWIASCKKAKVEALQLFACAHLDEALAEEGFKPSAGAMVKAGLTHSKALNIWGIPRDFNRVVVARLIFIDGNLLHRQRVAKALSSSSDLRDQLLLALMALSRGTFDPYLTSEKWRKLGIKTKDPMIVAFCKAASDQIKMLRKCEPCKGQGRVPCARCKTAGIVACTPCKGTGRIPEGFFGDTIPCRTCKSKAKVICPDCRGSRKTKCVGCNGKKTRRAVPAAEVKELLEDQLCAACEGDGSVFVDLSFPCPKCKGAGRFPTE